MAHGFSSALFRATTIICLFLQAPGQTAGSTTNGDLPLVRHFVAPAYPMIAWTARMQGTVVAEVAVNADGKVTAVKFVSAHPIFRNSVEGALKQWSFQASKATTLTITIEFKLDADCPMTGSQEPDKRYHVQTMVSADLPSNVEVRTCLPILTIDSNQTQRD